MAFFGGGSFPGRLSREAFPFYQGFIFPKNPEFLPIFCRESAGNVPKGGKRGGASLDGKAPRESFQVEKSHDNNYTSKRTKITLGEEKS